MIVRYALQPVFHVADQLVSTYCGRPVSPSDYWKERHHLTSASIGDEVAEVMWGYICGGCVRVAQRKGMSQYNNLPKAAISDCSKRMRATSIVDMVRQREFIKSAD